MTPKSGKVIAWLSFLLGISVSVAGNIGHAASDGMKPGEWGGATFWPLALMLTVEILTRVRWQIGWTWAFAKIAALILVAVVAAALSYRHLAGLMTYWGEDRFNAHLGPLAVDGLMLIAATALLSISRETVVADSTDRRHVFQWPQPIGPKPVPVKAIREPEPASKLHVVGTVSDEDAESAVYSTWVASGGTLSSQKLADLTGISKSTAARRISTWKQSDRRIVR